MDGWMDGCVRGLCGCVGVCEGMYVSGAWDKDQFVAAGGRVRVARAKCADRERWMQQWYGYSEEIIEGELLECGI